MYVFGGFIDIWCSYHNLLALFIVSNFKLLCFVIADEGSKSSGNKILQCSVSKRKEELTERM
jgi:hypothetical protein